MTVFDEFESSDEQIADPSGHAIWDGGRFADEFAVSPVDTIVTFLRRNSTALATPPEVLLDQAAQVAVTVTGWRHLLRERLQRVVDLDLPASLDTRWVVPQPTMRQRWELIYSQKSQPVLPLPDQLSLRLKGDFAPSRDLTAFWVRGVTAHARQAAPSSSEVVPAPTDLEIRQEFAKAFASLMGTIGQQLRYSTKRELYITVSGLFKLAYANQLCDRFLISPYETPQFLEMLRNELVSALSDGSKIEGAWGRICVDSSGELYYVLTPPRVVRDQSFIRAEEVE